MLMYLPAGKHVVTQAEGKADVLQLLEEHVVLPFQHRGNLKANGVGSDIDCGKLQKGTNCGKLNTCRRQYQDLFVN